MYKSKIFLYLTSAQLIKPRNSSVFYAFMTNLKPSSKPFKKLNEIGADPKQDNDGDYAELIRKADIIQKLSGMEDHLFHDQRRHLPLYLFRISQLIRQKQFGKYQLFLKDIYYKTRKMSSQLLITPQELIQILMFCSVFQKLSKQSKMKREIGGFEARISTLAANMFLQQSITLSEATTIFALLNDLKMLQLLAIQNYTVYLKKNIQKGNHLQIEHILTLMGIYVEKNHKSVLQNVLVGMVLSEITSMAMFDKIDLLLRIETLRLFVSLQSWQFYQVQSSLFSNVIQYNLNKIQNLEIQNLRSLYFQRLVQQTNVIINSQIRTLLFILDKITISYNSDTKILDQCERLFQSIFSTFNVLFKNEFTLKMYKFIEQVILHPKNQKFVIKNDQLRLKLLPSFIQLLNSNKVEINYIKIIYFFQKQVVQLVKNRPKLVVNRDGLNWNLIKFTFQKIKREQRYAFIMSIDQLLQKHFSLINHESQFIMFMSILTYYSNSFQQEIDKINDLTNQISKSLQVQRDNHVSFVLSLVSLKQKINMKFYWQIISKNTKIMQNLLFNLCGKSQRTDEYQVALIQLLFIAGCSNNQFSSRQMLKLFKSQQFQERNQYQFLKKLIVNNSVTLPITQSLQSLIKIDYLRGSKILVEMFVIDKYYFLIWEIMIKNYLLQEQSIKEQSFQVLSHSFLRALDKETARRVVLLSNLTNLLANNQIFASRSQLQTLFRKSLIATLSTSQKSFHYYCYLKIAVNSLACELISLESFTQIIQIALNRGKSLSQNSILMLLYGMFLHCNSYKSLLLSQVAINNQREYLKKIIKSKMIVFRELFSTVQAYEISNKKPILVTSQYVGMLFMSGLPEILNLSSALVKFIQNLRTISDINLIKYCFKIQNFKIFSEQQKAKLQQINEAIVQRIDFYDRKRQMQK